jgi:class 3 adenylate cyclase
MTPGAATVRPSPAPSSYIPKHLAERILSSKAALEGERKQVTVLFADLKGSMELLTDRDPEEARKILDPVLEHMMEAVHRYEGTVNQVMGDGIMALFGASLAPRGPRRARLPCGAEDAVVGADVCRGGFSGVGCWRRAEMRMTSVRRRADRPAPEARVAGNVAKCNGQWRGIEDA